ncbi:galectin-12 isoform X2 [Phodopus roborovskii]|uniref:galectin-12 isoform X2 n=1 Tax=Phodopus roborovskii TaxID=109678 RepID=UPI0021E4F762|nr:galectin-12 isoform X2 [Phodopus roborovskii]
MSADEHLDPIPDSFILQPPVFHPVVPYVTTIFGGLYAGKMVMLQGVVPLRARRISCGSLTRRTSQKPHNIPTRFQVDFQCGCCVHPRPDIAFHFNPRFYTVKPHVICNSLQGGLWQKEVRWPGVTLKRGASFLILFLFESKEVKVSVNGQHFLHYRYQLPLSRVDTLGIYGDILVKAVGFLNINPFVEGRREYPVGYPFLLYSPRLEVPCSRTLPRGLWPGQVIVVRGLILQEPKDFTLSLRDGTTHVPVTLRASFTDRTLAWVSSWGRKKLISAPFLFYPQRFFEEGGLKLALNGQGLGATSLDQKALEQLRELRITGSVHLYCVYC